MPISRRLCVYRLAHPNHIITGNPGAVIKLPVSGLGLEAPICNLRPHDVNHIIASSFGAEEILLIACDDGDVLGYQTRSIERLLEEKDASDCNYTSDQDHVGPFFHVNVGHSAWGLAAHKESRQIAISANSHRITVYSFGLTTRTSNETKRCD